MLQFFGYAMIDGCFHDPGDARAQNTNYMLEVAAFSNVAQMCVSYPTEAITSRLNLMTQNRMNAILSVQALFFQPGSNVAPSGGKKLVIRPDYLSRWNAFVSLNDLINHAAQIQAFYVVDEPTWNGVSYKDLKTAADTIKARFPSIPNFIVEASQALNNLAVPPSIDWIGMDEYAVPDPANDIEYLNQVAILRSKKSSHAQKLVVVMEGRWLPEYDVAGFAPSDMAAVATSYYILAHTQPDVIGIMVYLWPGGFDKITELGSRELPTSVQATQAVIGRSISGK